MQIRILGSSAGGGSPQWNCHCHNCRAIREGRPGFERRTQSSLAVSGDGTSWVLLNASPDLREQLAKAPALSALPDGARRGSPIKAAVLTNGDVDHIAGLLNLREMEPFTIYAGKRVLDSIGANSIFNVLDARLVPRKALPLDRAIELENGRQSLGLLVEAFAVPGKVALYLEDEANLELGSSAGDTIALKVTSAKSGRTFYYIPACARIDGGLKSRLRGADLLFFDGTLYTDDEMVAQGLMPKTGARMGHISMSGPDGSVAALAGVKLGRRVYVHINNSNPVLDANSSERRAVEQAGWEVGFDGMEITL